MLRIEKTEPTIPRINMDAVNWYQAYFDNVLQSYTFQLRLNSDQIYYIFSTVPQQEWEEIVKDTRQTVQATRYLDNIQMESLFIHNIKTIKDVTLQVRAQYMEQRNIIFDSYELVSNIMLYKEQKFVRDMIDIVLRNRENDESKRRYWRVLNEKYYGLDIHPLMEYEQGELVKMLHYCKNPELLKHDKWVPVLKTGGVATGVATVSYVAYQLIF